jgi:hypothetical protein
MSSSLKSQDDYLVYEIPSGDSEGHGSVVIIPKSSQGFSWNEGTSTSAFSLTIDVFLSRHHLNALGSPTRLSSSADSGSFHSGSPRSEEGSGREEDFVDVHEIHLENDHTEPWWDDLA